MRHLNPKFALNFIVIILLLTNSLLFAHGELTARIAKKTEQISKDSSNGLLYYERGFLYQQHEEYDKALADFEKSETLGYKDKILYYRRADTYFILKKTSEALTAVDSYFEIDSIDIKIYKLKAQILIQDQKYEEALVSYDYVLKNTIDLRPEDFIEHANIILAIDPKNYKDAISSMDLGLETTGENTLTLQLTKLDYQKAAGETEAVISQYNSFIAANTRKESWYYQKAEYLASIERTQEANIALQQAKLAVQMLNPKFQQTPAIKKLINKINQLEKTL